MPTFPVLDPGIGIASITDDHETHWGSKVEIDVDTLGAFINEYIKKNLTIDVVTWGDNRISLQILIAGKVLSEKTIELNIGSNNG